MKIFLDDVRNPPTDDWMVFRTAEALKQFILENNYITGPHDIIEEISLDHDLGEGMTGYDFLNWLESHIWLTGDPYIEGFSIHSANPAGRQNMERAINSIRRWV